VKTKDHQEYLCVTEIILNWELSGVVGCRGWSRFAYRRLGAFGGLFRTLCRSL